MKRFLILCLLYAPAVSAAAADDSASAGASEAFLFNFQGSAQHSRYNFTDIKKPYDGIDGYAVLKGDWWFIPRSRVAGLYLEVVPVYSGAEEFWWQRNAQLAAGIEYLPLSQSGPAALKGVRLYAFMAWRSYYDKPAGTVPQKKDFQAGVDYYYENLLSKPVGAAYMAFANIGYRRTNFSDDDYHAFTYIGNVKAGPKLIPAGKTFLFPYGLMDWTCSPSYRYRWWENFVRAGVGTEWYLFLEPGRRLNIFAEWLSHAASPGHGLPAKVAKSDFRAGVRFSLGGPYRYR